MSAIVTKVGSRLSVDELYSLLCLRVGVFVVEQHIAYPDLDGLDLLPSTHHFWEEDEMQVLACLRVVSDGQDARIGRVCTRPEHRRKGLARNLMNAAINAFGEQPLVLEAQSYLVDFYQQFGFLQHGPVFLDDGVPHTPMRREATSNYSSGVVA